MKRLTEIMNKIIILILIHFFLFYNLIFAETKIKPPNVSGQFYSSSKIILSNQIDDFFKNVADQKDLEDKEILGLIAPHAGYIYSGQVAAHSYKAVKGKNFDAVIVLAPSHNYPFDKISVYKEGFFRTPLGDIEIDAELAQKLISYNEKIVFLSQVFEKEHSLEVQLPFLQKSIENLKIVPIILGQVDYTDCVMLARAITELAKDKKILVVSSTDLSHFHTYFEAVSLDKKTISYMEEIDPLGLWQACPKEKAELCGLNPVLVLLNYAKELGLKSKVLNYASSGDVTGDKSSVVGYVSAVFYKDKNQKGEESMFNTEQKKRLLDIARKTITDYVTNDDKPAFKEGDPQLNLKRGAFVTLHKHGELRGCIGSFTSEEPLYKVISNMAVESATGDPRFSPVTKSELSDIDIEISVLTEPKLIEDWKKISLGVDGVIVKRGFNQGVFLPQVATETGWDLETFLSHLCWSKAGLPPDSYKDPKTQIYTFQAIIFSEKELGTK